MKFKDYNNKNYNYDLSKLYTQGEIDIINKKLESKIQDNQITIVNIEN